MENIKMMTVGELAKEANVSVRTLQYYDKIDILKPSSFSEGGRRLYNSKDMALLHQIITFKSLGFSLNDIKDRIMPVNKPSDATKILNTQAEIIRDKIAKLQKLEESINMLSDEIKETNNIDWSKYAKMMNLVNENNEFYWVVKHLDEDTINTLVEGYENNKTDTSIDWWRLGCEKVIELESKGLAPESFEGQEFAKEWWGNIIKFTNGDSEVFGKLMDFREDVDNWPEDFKLLYKKADAYINKALETYIIKNNVEIPEGMGGE
ncbi:MerR family transcriptional regulator [Clostridium intestinale]|uniref:MerR family transcriptional regulator n=1 Tax=Clostridium intestinale TaxID=36845 RepID=UPI0028E18E22|nr:MerR family transcriptional regulator [Clostridium intestinale]